MEVSSSVLPPVGLRLAILLVLLFTLAVELFKLVDSPVSENGFVSCVDLPAAAVVAVLRHLVAQARVPL